MYLNIGHVKWNSRSKLEDGIIFLEKTEYATQVILTKLEGYVLFNEALNTFVFTVIWRQTYGKGPLR